MAPKVPSLRVVFDLEKVPASLGTETFYFANDSLADLQFTEGRVVDGSYAAIDTALSSHDGHYAGAMLQFVLNDQDGRIGSLLGNDETSIFTGRNARFEMLSVEGRAAGLTWRTIFNGRCSDAQPAADRTVRFEIRDLLSSEFAGIALDRPVGRTLIKELGLTETPASIANAMIPQVVGEHSDKGTVDAGGNSAEQGVLPAKFVGWQRIKDDNTIGGPGGPVYCGPPLNLNGTRTGSAGSRSLFYSVSAITATGETIASGVFEMANAPNDLDDFNYVTLTWDPPATYGSQVVKYRINGREANPPTRYVGLVDVVTTFADKGQDGENLPASPEVSNAVVSTPAAGGGSERARGVFLLGHGAVKPHGLYVSNLGGDDEARASSGRKAYPLDSSDVLSPYLDGGSANPGWPYGDPWIEFNGIRVTVLFIEGPRLQDHLDGKVTIAWNGCGYDASGDQDGPVVDQPGEAIPMWINEFLLKNNGEGYKGGSFGPMEAFADGTHQINTQSFNDCQDLSKIWLGNAKGYLCSWYIDDVAETVRQRLQWLQVNFGWFFTAADYGQIFSAAIDDTGSLSGAAHYRQDIEILDSDAAFPPAEIRNSDVENLIRYQFHFMPDQGKFRSSVITIADDDARLALRGAFRDSGTIDCRGSNDRETCEDAMARRLLRRKLPAIYQRWTVGIAGIEQKFTSQPVLLTHTEGGRGGYVQHPFFLMGRRFEPNVFQFGMLGMSVLRILNATIDWFKDTDSEFSDTGSEFR